MLIAIPSKGRATRQTTLYNLPQIYRDCTHLVVEPQEQDAYRSYGVPMIVLPLNNMGIGYSRQHIIKYCVEYKISKVFMMDDDLTFARRREDDHTKFRTATDIDVQDAISDIDSMLDQYTHVSIAAREGANRRTEPYVSNIRPLRMLGYRVDVLNGFGIRFDLMDMMEDFHVALSLLLKGCEHRVLNWLVHNQAGSNTQGGMSTHRTMEAQHIAATILATRFPEFVRLVKKQTKTAWGGQERTDVIISWKAAWEYGIAKYDPSRLTSPLDQRA